MSGRDANQPECGHDEQFDCPKCRDPKEWPQLAPMSERDANPPKAEAGRTAPELAADVRIALNECDCEACIIATTALDELVGLVGTLQRERDEVIETLDELSPFPRETVFAWKRRSETAEAMLAAVRMLLDPDRQDEPDEENTRRAFEAAGGRLS